MNNEDGKQSKIRFNKVSYAHAEKRLMAFMSDNSEDIMLMQRYRLALSTTIMGGTLGGAAFVVPGEGLLGAFLKIGVLIVGFSALDKADADQAHKIFNRKSALVACEELMGKVTKQEGGTVLFPNNLEEALLSYANKKGTPPYIRSKDPARWLIGAGLALSLSVAGFQTAKQTDIEKIRDWLYEEPSQSAFSPPDAYRCAAMVRVKPKLA